MTTACLILSSLTAVSSCSLSSTTRCALGLQRLKQLHGPSRTLAITPKVTAAAIASTANTWKRDNLSVLHKSLNCLKILAGTSLQHSQMLLPPQTLPALLHFSNFPINIEALLEPILSHLCEVYFHMYLKSCRDRLTWHCQCRHCRVASMWCNNQEKRGHPGKNCLCTCIRACGQTNRRRRHTHTHTHICSESSACSMRILGKLRLRLHT